MLEKLNELNAELVRRLNNRDFKVEDPHITKRDDMTTLRCDIVIDDMRFYAYTDDSTMGLSAWCENVHLPKMSEGEKAGVIRYLWMVSSGIIMDQHKAESATLQKSLTKVASLEKIETQE
jgi:hypothetical protein